MTVLEFEAWVSDNYEDLVALAGRMTRHSGNGTDSLHDLVEGLIEAPEKLAKLSGDISPWFNRALHLSHIEGLRENVLHERLEKELAADMRVLGEDAFVDPKATNKRRRQERYEATRKRVNGKRVVIDPTPSSNTGVMVEWEGPMPGSVRWRFQTLRDNKLFDERAIRSLAGSMHRASQAYRHFGEHGFAFSEFGQEMAR